MDLSNYKLVDYKEIQKELAKKRDACNIHELNIAANINVKAVSTVRSAFNEEEQLASDEVLTKVFKELGLNAFVGWVNGERRYFISTTTKR